MKDLISAESLWHIIQLKSDANLFTSFYTTVITLTHRKEKEREKKAKINRTV